MEREIKRLGFKRYKPSESSKLKLENPNNNDPNPCQNLENYKNQYEIKIDELTESVAHLQGAIQKLEAIIVTQNTTIMEALATQKVLMEKLIGKEKDQGNLKKLFPIQTADDLAKVNNGIKEANRGEYIRLLSFLLKGQLQKSIPEIFSVDFIVSCNIDGIHGKISLKESKRLFDVLLEAIRNNGEEEPEKALRYAFKLVKKRHFQSVSLNKKKDNNKNGSSVTI